MCQTDHIIVSLHYRLDTLHCAVFYTANSSAVYTSLKSLPKAPFMDRNVPVLPEISYTFCIPEKKRSNMEEVKCRSVLYHDDANW